MESLRLAMGCRAWRCGSPFSPADPGQSFFTHPTQRLRCNRLPGTRPFPRWRWRPNISWSFRACSFVPSRSSLDQSKRARVKEHRLSENSMGLVCRLPRAQGLTRLIHPFWCAHWASKGDQRVGQFRLHRLPPSLPAWHSSRWSCSTILRSGSRFLPPAWPCPMPPDLPLAHGL